MGVLRISHESEPWCWDLSLIDVSRAVNKGARGFLLGAMENIHRKVNKKLSRANCFLVSIVTV